MSFGLGHGRELDDAPGVIGVARDEIPPLPDEAITNPDAGLLDPRAWFADPQRPFEIEIGSGKGAFLLAQAAASPGVNYLGIEWAREFYLYAADRLRRAGVANVRMLNADATEFLRWRCPPGIARVIHLYFSDPWPKSRHHKNRVVQDAFLAQCLRVLAPGGELRLVTDHPDLWTWYRAHIARWTTTEAWAKVPERCAPNADRSRPPFDERPYTPPDWVSPGELIGTNYERKYRAEGRGFNSTILVKPA
ncbi:MAG: tRNA (guanosine(46)-N7)-methyltransferase TrmB [Phycisphaerales bacterium]|nr:tRNA (guanosine(46)-N7)-methyltransferase TrmB [Phycisphaerales bacterium]